MAEIHHGTQPRLGITIDCHDPQLLAEFWASALAYRPAGPPRGWVSWESFYRDHGVPAEEWNDGAFLEAVDGSAPSISFLKVPESKTVKNRVHLDIQISGGRDVDQSDRELRIRVKQADLSAAGASVVFEDFSPGHLDHVVMQDPEGNEFCIV